MSGPITLAGNASQPLQAVPLQQLNSTASAPVTATGTPTPRAPADRFADVVNVKDFGAVFDGASHPLSAYYSTLAAAQAVYPKATALTNEIDGIAIQAALDFCAARSGSTNEYSYGGSVVLPNGKGLMNTPLTISTSCVSLTTQGHGIAVRELTARFSQSAPCHLKWTGAAVAAGSPVIYMLTIAVTDGGRRISSSNVTGIYFDCSGVVGVSGVLLGSVIRAEYYIGVGEARGVPYSGSVLTAGSQNITVSSTAGIGIGQAITSPNTVTGAYVAAIIDGTTIQASAQAIASATEAVLIGGECIRLDCVSSITDVNDTQMNDLWLICLQEVGAQYSYGPCIMLNGSSNPGSAPGFTHYGNTSINTFHIVQCTTIYGPGLVVNNTDHNYFLNVGINSLGGTPKGIVLNGSLSANNGTARYNLFDYAVGVSIYAVGTDTGGFTTASAANTFRNADTQNASSIGAIGVGAGLAVSNLAAPTLLVPTNSQASVVSQSTDSTIAGGNARGINAVDLQMVRTAATQVASGGGSVIVGGGSNTASATYATVLGGQSNSVSATYATVLGGTGNSVTQSIGVASGTGAISDLYAAHAHAGGVVSSGRRAQHVKQVLRGVSAGNTTPVRLTADGLAASAINVCNLTYSDSAFSLKVQMTAIDSTNGNNFYSWHQPLGLLRRNGGVGATAYTALGTPVSGGAGTTTGIAVTEAADTTNGGYSLTFTPPTGNTAIWRVVATVEWTRVDGT